MRLQRLNPFRSLPNPREVWAWSMYDLANQSFTVLINTVFFAIYFSSRVAENPDRGGAMWGMAVAVSNLLVVLSAPILGALADFTGAKKRLLFLFYALCVACTCALGLVTPGAVVLALALYIPANFFFAAGENVIGAFLPELADSSRMGRVSAIGWTLGYVGTLLVLPASLLITGATITDGEYRLVFVFAGLWFLVFASPTFLFVRERKAPEKLAPGERLLTVGFARLTDTARHAARFGHFLRFLAFFLIYSCGTQVIIYFAALVTKTDFGFSDLKLTLFMLQLAVSAGIGAAITGLVQDRIGHRRTLHAILILWVVAVLGAAVMPRSPDFEWAIWLAGNVIGVALGAIGTGSRALVGLLTPLHKTAEFFGLWGVAYRLAGVLGPPIYGLAAHALGSSAALLIVAGFFAAGFLGLFLVDEREGAAAARRAGIEAGPAAADARDKAAIAGRSAAYTPPS